MDVFKLSRNFFDWSFENPEKITPTHSAIFFFAIEHCNRLGWKEKFGFPTSMAMEAIGIRKWETYNRAFRELVEWGFIIEIEKSKNQYSSCIISISSATPKNGKALDKALVKHGKKHSESIGESKGVIDIQETNKQETRNNTTIVVMDTEQYGDKEINIIIETIKKYNNGIIDGTIQSNRRYGKLLKGKISKIIGFDGDYCYFLTRLITQTDQYNIGKTTSCESIYYNLASLVAKIKTTHIETKEKEEELKPKTWRLQPTTSITTT